MKESALRLIKNCAEYTSIDEINQLPRGLRGIYVLYYWRPRIKKYDVVYVGLASTGQKGGIRGRLKKHRDKKAGLWTHCSIFEVWDNISHAEVLELEGLFRHIYREDSKANKLNKQKGFRKLRSIRISNISEWQ